jgi:crotonobetaine/carnitine-CoA ligase
MHSSKRGAGPQAGASAFNIKKDFYAQGRTIIEKLSEWVRQKPDSPCLFYGDADMSYSYKAFDQQCNRMANGLAKLGVKKGDRVSVLSKNAYATVVTMVASWKLGAIYCPICSHYKGDMLAYILNDTAPKLLVADQQFIGDINSIDSELDKLEQLVIYSPPARAHDYDQSLAAVRPAIAASQWSGLLKASEQPPELNLLEDDIANIIYTSGTTGNPKGVVQSHKWLHNYCYFNISRAMATPEQDTIIYNDLPLYHVGGAFFNVASAFWSGSQIALWDRFSAADFWQRIRTSGATQATLIDVMLDWLMKTPSSNNDRDHSLSVVSMTPLPDNHREIAQRFGLDFIVSGYGSTEVGVGFFGVIESEVVDPKTCSEYRQNVREHYQAMSPYMLITGKQKIRKGFMGVPSPLMDVSVVDEENNPVAINEPGRVLFKPVLQGLVLTEYFNKPELTSEAIKNDWYYSPDIVQYDESGIYYFQDRMQGFIRVRGENVSAMAVEHQLNKHPDIQRSAVVGIPAEEGNEQEIAAFIIKEKGRVVSDRSIREWLEVSLPKFMWPKYLRFIEKLPVTNTFKVEKYKLKEIILSDQFS